MFKSSRLTVTVALCAASFVSHTLFAGNVPAFGTPQVVTNATPAGNLVMGDFDGDGIPDVAVMGAKFDTNGMAVSGSVEVHFGNGAGGFKSTTAIYPLNFPGGSYTGFAAADLSGSGQSQLIIAGSNSVVILNWNGQNFSLTTNIDLSSTGINAAYVSVGDLTRHGSRDIIVSDHWDFENGSIGLVWIPNDGKGNFGTPSVIPAGCATPPVLADVNGDGLVDIVLDNPASIFGVTGTVGVLLNNGNGTFASEVVYGNQPLTNSSGNLTPKTIGVAVADVDGDGKPDLISACFIAVNFPNYTYFVSVNLGNGDGTFQNGMTFLVTNGITAMAVGDVNGDGQVDLVTVDYDLIDQAYPGFMVTEFSGMGNNLAVARQTDFSAPFADSEAAGYSALSLGYYASNGVFTTFNKDPKIDVLLGTGRNIYGASNTVYHQFLVYRSTTTVPTLPPTSVKITSTLPPVAGAPIQFSATQTSTASGLIVRIQATTTPTVEGSWTDLPDGNGGHLTLTGAGTYTFPNNGTLFYPFGTKIYFRAITSAPGYTDSISTFIGPYALTQAALTINVRLTSTSDPTGALHIAHIGDTLTYTFAWTNIGTATAHNLHVKTPVPTYIDANSDITYQFAHANLTFNQYGKYTNESSAGAGDASVTWAVSDLAPGSSQTVTLAVRLDSSVRLQEAIGLPNSYEVYSSANEPPTAAFGFTSGAANPYSTILAPITFLLYRSSATVAPGGLFTYSCILSNLSSTAVTHAVAVVDVPQFTRFAASYPTGPKTTKASLIYSGKGAAPTYKHIYYQNGNQSQVVIQVGALSAHGDKAGRDSIILYVTFQAEWADPTEVPTISSGDYLAAFVNTASFASFTAAYNAAGSTAAAPGTNDFVAYLDDPSRVIDVTKDESGVVNISLQGSLDGAPHLALLKFLSASLTNAQSDGNGHTVSIVKPGDEITYALTAFNKGASEADDVFIEDVMPDSSSFVSGGLLYAATKTKSTPSTINSAATFTIVQDPDGHHLRFEGLQIASGDNVSLEYTVRVFNGAKASQPAPPPGTFIDPAVALDTNGQPRPDSIGSSSTPNTWAGYYIAVPLEVVGPNQFAQPIIRTLIPHPAVSPNVIATSNTLTAFYKKYPNDVPLTNAADPTAFYPGFERYYIHYVNTGKAVTGAKLNVPLPAHASFFRAVFVTLTANVVPGELGYLPGTPIANPSGASVVPPSSPDGTVIIKLPPLGVAQQGDVMVEVIIAPDAVQTVGSLLGDPNAGVVSIYDATITAPAHLASEVKEVTLLPPAHQNTAAFAALQLTADFLINPVPSVGILKWLPQQVRQGDTFQVALVIYNYGAVDAHAIVDFTIPPNTEFVSADAGQSYVLSPPDPSPGHLVEANLASNDGPIYPDSRSLAPLTAHTAAALTVTLRATGSVGSSIVDNNTVVTVDQMGRAYALGTTTSIVDPGTAVSPSMLMVHTSVPLLHTIVNNTDVAILDIGGGNIVAAGAGNIVAAGAGNIVAQGAGNIVAQGAGNIVAQGAGNIIPIGTGTDTGASLLASEASIVAQGAGNILVPAGASIVAQGAGNIVAAGAGNIVAQGAGNIVAQGAGNIVAQGAGNIVAQGAGNIVAQGAGNIVAAGAGNIVAQGAGNIVSTGGSNVLPEEAGKIDAQESMEKESNQTKGFILASTPGSTAVIQTKAGNLFGIGGGTFKPIP